MRNIIKIAWRNLLRYKRRTLLTSSLIATGVILVIVFGGIGDSFRNEVTGILTESNLGDIQIHRKGYIGSIDNLPLDLTIPESSLKKIKTVLDNDPGIESYSERIRFGAMLSSFIQTTTIRLTAVYPEKESRTCPRLIDRIKEGEASPDSFVKPGFIVIPFNVVNGMNLKVGDDIVLVANNKDGSVNGLTLKISGISENILGPQGKDGYIHINDARTILRIENNEITEIAVKLADFNQLKKIYSGLKKKLMKINSGKNNRPQFEIHTWEDLSPFASIARIVTLLIIVVRVVLVSIVLISILNVMMMSVYERIGEIGTIASIGTLPSKILYLFLTEGLALGFLSATAGSMTGMLILLIIRSARLKFTFGMMNLTLSPSIPLAEIVLSIIIVIIISTLASLQPAIKASRMEPVEALRHV